MKRSVNDVEQDNARLATPTRHSKRPRTEYNYEAAAAKQFSNPTTKQRTKADATVPAKARLEALVDHTVKELHTLISLEIDKQRKLLCGRFYTSSLREFTQDMMDFWCREAQVFEDRTLAQLGLDVKDIESPRGMVLQMMKRQYEILQKAWHKQFPPPKDTRSLEYQRYREHAKRSILISQLQELQRWTARWQQRLKAGADQPQARPSRHRDDGLHQRPERSATGQGELRNNQEHQNLQLPLPARDQNLPVQGGARPCRPSMARNRPQQRDFSRTFIDYCPRISPPKSQHIRTPDLLIAQSDHLGQHTLNAQQPQEQDYQHGPWTGYANVPQNQPQHVGKGHGGALGAQFSRVQGQASAASSSVEMPAGAQANSYTSRATLTTTKAQPPGATGNVQPFAVGHQQAPAQQSQACPARKQRGAPRQRMFLEAPPRETPLPPSALSDEDEILNRFPEHLSHPVVMRRFVHSSTSRLGGYPTGDMVDTLLKHNNARDFNGITKEQRRANLHRWVVNRKDACNKKLKEGRVPTSLPASLTANPPRAQPTQVPASSSIMAMPPQRLQVQSAIMPPVIGHALGCSTASSRLGPVGTSSATVRSQATSLVAASPHLNGSFNMYDDNQYPVDSRLPDLVLDHSGSYDFDLGIERETGPAMDTLDHASIWSLPGNAATGHLPDVRTNSGEKHAAEPDSRRLESVKYDPELERLLNTT